ncbi:MAG: ribonucleoside-diphosphate reductase [Thermoleophilaceae bacterium]|nr:ribonucleoside-diphosphate reductase [Thermoleophilaceae bacterium]
MPSTPSTAPDTAPRTGQGVRVARRFTEAGVHPFDAIEWEMRDAVIGDPAEPAFEQLGVEFPKSWSQNATNIVAQKYFRGQVGSPERENSVKQIVGRVSGTIAGWGRGGGYFGSEEDAQSFEDELTHILLNQMAAFNSPVWFNLGFEERPQASACFILSVEDDMDSILDWNTKEGNIFRGGSGSGINLSNIRGSMEPLKKGGTASGPVSFMRGADAWAGTIKSGGKTRRAAKMVVLDIDHPDIVDFIECKAREERKANALRDSGFDMSIDGEGFFSIQYQNANNSVRVTDDFMEAVEQGAKWRTTARTTGETVDTIDARELMNKIAQAAWACADPGVQYDTTINDWHTCPVSGRINASNPCFPADARVHTTLGQVAFGELYERAQGGEEFSVYTHCATAEQPGEGVVATRPLAVMRNGVKPIVRLRFAGGQELRCTPNHRIWTLNRGYVRAEDVTNEDRVLLNDSPTPATDASWALPVKVATQTKSFSRGGSVAYQELPDAWSEGLGELTGHLIGDGWLTDVQTGWIYGGDDIDDGLADSHEGMLRDLVGGVSRQEMDNGTVQLRAGSEAVREFFRGLGITSARAPEKRVPASVFGAPVEVQAAFLRGLYGADGCVARAENGKANRYVGLGSRSEALLKDVQRMLAAFGIRGRIYAVSGSEGERFSYTRKDGSEVGHASRQGFDLRVTGSDLERFAEAIGFSTPRKEAALDTLLGESGRYATKRGTTLVAREDDGQEVVYNLTEPLHHSYIVDGFVVANCSEYMHVDDSACNLASLNLMKFRRTDGSFDVESFEHAVDVVLLAQEIVVSPSSYPTPEIGENARAFRQLGLGYANLGALLMSNGLPYDSDEGRATAGAITALMTGRAYRKSAEIAEAMGPYERYPENAEAHNGVMRKHRDAAHAVADQGAPDMELLAAARRSWDEAVALGEEHGYRNAQATVLAPTGTISFLMDCDTTGIEPDFSLVKFKELVGGGSMTIVNRTVPQALETLGYTPEQIGQIEAHINATNSIVGAPALSEEHMPVFDVAVGERAISHMGHIKMMGAAQPFISGAISKTVNLPAAATVEDVADAYTQAWRLGIKALAIYRDGSKTAQALRTDAQETAGSTDEKDVGVSPEAAPEPRPMRRRMPQERQSITHKFSIAGHEGYITAGMYEDGTVGEIFLTDIGKEGSTLRGMMNAFATGISIALQYGVPLETLVRKYSYMRFDPEGITLNPEIPFAKSMPDYIMRWLASRFLDVDVCEELGILTTEVRARKEAQEALMRGDTAGPPAANGGNGGANGAANGGTAKPAASAMTDTPPPIPAKLQGLDLGPACSQCGGMMQRTGSCYTCSSCGNNTGCG